MNKHKLERQSKKATAQKTVLLLNKLITTVQDNIMTEGTKSGLQYNIHSVQHEAENKSLVPMEIKILELQVVNKSSECSHVSST
jgi:hypothetical protein